MENSYGCLSHFIIQKPSSTDPWALWNKNADDGFDSWNSGFESVVKHEPFEPATIPQSEQRDGDLYECLVGVEDAESDSWFYPDSDMYLSHWPEDR